MNLEPLKNLIIIAASVWVATWAAVTFSTWGYYTRKYTDGRSGAVATGFACGMAAGIAVLWLGAFVMLFS